MSDYPVYSTLFSTIYDEQKPIGNIGRGCHYSILRCVEWIDSKGIFYSQEKPRYHDLAIIWDEDHDTRIIEVLERIYMKGLLFPVQFIGERKGFLTIAVNYYWYKDNNKSTLHEYEKKIEQLAFVTGNDQWIVEVNYYERFGIFETNMTSDTKDREIVYLQNIDNLWSLGQKIFEFNDDNKISELMQLARKI